MGRNNIDDNVKLCNGLQQLSNKLELGSPDGLALDSPSTLRLVLSVNFCKKYTDPEKSNDITDLQGFGDGFAIYLKVSPICKLL